MNILENLKKLNLDFFKKNFLLFLAILFLFLDAVSTLNYFKFFIHFPSEIFRSYQHSIIFFKGVIILSLIIAFCVFILRKYFKTYKTYCFLFLAILFLTILSKSALEVFSMPTSTLSTIFTIPTICLLIFTFFTNLCYIFYPPIIFSSLIIASFASIIIKYFKIGLAIYFIFLICWAIVLESADGFGVAAGGLIGFVTIFPYSIILGISHFKFARKKNESLTKWSIVVFSLVYFMGYPAMLIARDIIEHLF